MYKRRVLQILRGLPEESHLWRVIYTILVIG